MLDLALGAVAGVIASALFSGGLVLQSLEARSAGGDAWRPSTILRLARRRRWLAGAGAMVVGFGFHVVALLFAPLTLVQPMLAAGLILLLVAGSRIDNIPIQRRDALGVAALAVALVILTLTSPERTTVSASAGTLAVTLGALGALALAPVAVRTAWGLRAAACAGAAYALTGVTTKLTTDRLADGDVAGVALWLAVTVVGALLAVIDQTMALQRRTASQVGVLLYVLPVIVPVLLAPVLVGERWSESPGGGIPLGLAVAAVCAASALLSTSRQVAEVT
jgi:hypothetical protein